MNCFEQLQDRVVSGELRIIDVVAVPRSVSTALSRSLNEAEGLSVYVNEPFNRRAYNIEEAAGHVLVAAETALSVPEANQPLTVVTKNMARNFTPELFRRWMNISAGVAWCVRNPLVQVGSFLTRVANDLFVEPGANTITQDTLGPYIARASAHLEGSHVSEGFSKTSWAAMGQHFRSGDQPEQSIVIDGGELSRDPTRVLGEACTALAINFNSRMISGWRRDYVNANKGYSNKPASEDGWTSHAASSSGIEAISRTALSFSDLPLALQTHMIEIAIPVYEEMTGRAYNLL